METQGAYQAAKVTPLPRPPPIYLVVTDTPITTAGCTLDPNHHTHDTYLLLTYLLLCIHPILPILLGFQARHTLLYNTTMARSEINSHMLSCSSGSLTGYLFYRMAAEP